MGALQNAARLDRSLIVLAACVLLAACRGDGGNAASAAPPPADPPSGWVPGSFLPAATFKAQCAAPRTGVDPRTAEPYPDLQGSVLDENNWLRSWSNDLYLWYDEIVDRDPGIYSTLEYFHLQKTTATTSSGAPRDKFHFTIPTDDWQALSQSGVSASYGVEWAFVSFDVPREAVVAFTQPGSPADAAGLVRGDRLLEVGGVDFVNDASAAATQTLSAALFPADTGQTHSFTVQGLDAVERTVTLESTEVTAVPVPSVETIDTLTGTVGYLLFNDHIATAEQALVDAVSALEAAEITDLVLDLRYNGGGFLVIASQLAYMIAGEVPTAGRVFEEIRFNDKHPSTNPITGTALAPFPFVDTTVGLSAPVAGENLPVLNLPRVFVLTGGGTCSASESIVNSLRGVDVEVIQIGSTTCGKPYGFFPEDNCGTTYFTIQFEGVNAKGFGDYSDGFGPANSTGPLGVALPGCAVADDYSAALGDPLEARLAAALAYRDSQTCPTPPALSIDGASKPALARSAEGRSIRGPWRENRILGDWGRSPR